MNADGTQMVMQQVLLVPTGGTMVPQNAMLPGIAQGGQEMGSVRQDQQPMAAPVAPEALLQGAPDPAPPQQEQVAFEGEGMPSSASGSQGCSDPAAQDQATGSSGSKDWNKERKWKVTGIPEG